MEVVVAISKAPTSEGDNPKDPIKVSKVVISNAPSPPPPPSSQAEGSEADILPGLRTSKRVLRAGNGAVVTEGSTVVVHALGSVAGSKFWSTKDPGEEAFEYTAGVGEVITGWDHGALGMRVGEICELLIPSEEGYGEDGFPAWGIPPNVTLKFELECLAVFSPGGGSNGGDVTQQV